MKVRKSRLEIGVGTCRKRKQPALSNLVRITKVVPEKNPTPPKDNIG
jgi:hypothetical protein